ncbi:type II RES/Xre toxin-antitoxin system antitoxin [Niabella ginsengisoli]|uniref:DUF2384 domain-containing protein n=1 Tax=Niabella ginsengisoli TaxID=522298 RepID=A0ABS9SJF5_9BACT|nr:antitoxin Xre-like helix-turn-helix domain-containing protein [Niabella ginsengisoli]MCH5598512.1 DUF2384 domain-containing protein [Niabella ginsengisoli]
MNNLLQEPEVAYITASVAKRRANNPVRRTIDLMGLDDDETYSDIESSSDFIDYIRDGIPKKALDTLANVIGLSATEMADIVHTSDRTLRRYTPAQKLSAEQSERLIELSRLYTRGEDVFGDIENFKRWVETPIIALGDKKPKEYLDTSIGINMLFDELGRIEHGIFA